MSGEAYPSAVSSTPNNWFSPAVLFFLLNLTIAFIAISSKLRGISNHEAGEQDNHYSHQRQGEGEEEHDHSNSCYSEPPTESQEQERESAETVQVQVQETEHEQGTEDIDDRSSYEEIYGNIKANGAWRREAPPRMGRLRSMKSDFGQYYERGEGSGGGGGDGEVERRRPATAREWREGDDSDEGVDARADDFINRFKQQLKLQRLESYSRHRAMAGFSGRNYK